MDTLLQDLRSALRTLRRRPGFTAVAVLTLALGIGASTAVFALVDSILIRPLPYPDADRLVVLRHSAPGLGMAEVGQSGATYAHYRGHSRVFEAMSTYYENAVNVTSGEGDAERVQVALVGHAFFATLGTKAAVGRLFIEADTRPDAEIVVVLSHDLWRRRFGSDPAVVGRVIELNGAPRRVIGVAEPGFGFPERGTDIWYVDEPNPDPTRAGLSSFVYSVVARLRPGISRQAAEAELNRLIPSLADAFPGITAERLAESGLRARVEPLRDTVVGDVAAALWLLLGGMGFLLLIACANVANLFLVRAEHRQKEVSIRRALGAGGGDLTRYFLGESLILAASGGLVGLAVAYVAVQSLVAFGPVTLPRLHEVGVDGRVAVFAAALAAASGALFAAVPFLRHGAPALSAVLKEGAHGATAGRERQRVRRLLVVAQVALALTLLIGSTLMARSFWRLTKVDPGFDAAGVLTLEIALPRSDYPSYAAANGLWNRLLERVRALPGVEAAGGVSGVPLVPLEAYYDLPMELADSPGRDAEARPVSTLNLVTPGYFEAMRIRIREGYGLGTDGVAAAVRPVLLSAALARRLFPDGSAVGRRVRRDGAAHWNTVIGVVGDVPRESVAGEPAEIFYIPVLESPVDDDLIPTNLTLAIRTGSPPASLAPAIRSIIRELDPDLPVANVRTMERIVADSMARIGFAMALLLVAAAAALFLGAVGIYGVISYAVGRRIHEIGVRLALGARPADVRRLVLRQGAGMALTGLSAGVLAALALTRFLGSLLFEVSPTDPLTIAATAVLLFAVALLATYLPARRAAAVDPMAALRGE